MDKKLKPIQRKRNEQLILRVLGRIMQHTQQNKIRIPVLAAEFDVDERKIKHLIAQLRKQGFKIASQKEGAREDHGVWLARTAEEIRPTAERLHQEAIELLKTVKRLLDWKDHGEPTIFEQLPDVPEELQNLVVATLEPQQET